MYTALYRTERPEVFSGVIGQEHIVRILKNQIAAGSVSHAYLFCGTRGTGKTTTARILAKAVNCISEGERPCGRCKNCIAIKEGNFMDVVEIDAASNNGVDNVRELRESVKYPPAVGRKKVYIIDEVHMLSSGAFNALLKTLEEPPENVMFILATTEPQKIPQTILSRCMRLDFKRVSERAMIGRMKEICARRRTEASEAALALIAANADGSVRDALSILDQCFSAGAKTIDRGLVLEFLGTVSEGFFIELTERTVRRDVTGALLKIEEAVREGKDARQLIKDWMGHYRNLLIGKYIKNAEDMLSMSSENLQRLREQSERISLAEISSAIVTLSKTSNDARYSTQPRILLELAAVALSEGFSGSVQAAGMELSHSAAVQAKPVRPVTRQTESAEPAAVQPEIAEAAAMKTEGIEPTAAQVENVRPAAAQEEDIELVPVQDGNGEFVAVQDFQAEQIQFETGDREEALIQQKTGAGAKDDMKTGEGRRDPGAEPEKNYSLYELWGRVIDEGEKAQSSVNILRNNARLSHIGETEFTIIVESAFHRDYVQKNRPVIVSAMEKLLKKKLDMKCVIEEDDNAG